MDSKAHISVLTLISFASSDVTEAVARDVKGLGFSIRVEPGAGWSVGENAARAPVLLLDPCDGAGLRSDGCVDRMKQSAWFCISEPGQSTVVEQLMRASTEFLELPWSRRELGLRLERFMSVVHRGGHVPEDDAEFVRLGIVANAPGFRAILADARRFGRSTAPLTIQGETGTGKELVARAVHALGLRAKGPFVPVNCGCLPAELVENELFGHEAGAFTGAGAARGGLVQQAHGGTLFLDEIDALTPRAQVALLRFLQEGEVRAVGAGRARGVDVRVLAASNVALRTLVAEGRFREDLYFRLNVFTLALPPLRERPEDIAPLARHFLDRYARIYQRGAVAFEPAALGWLMQRDWPGNVRQLENQVHRAVLNAEGERIGLTEMRACGEPPELQAPDRTEYFERFVLAKAQALEAFERHYLARLMRHCGGNVTAAAHFAGKERRALGKLLKKRGLDRAQFRSGA